MTHEMFLGPSRRQLPPHLTALGTHLCSQRAHHIKHLHGEYDVISTWLGITNWAILMEDSSDALYCMLVMLRMRNGTSCWEGGIPSLNLVLISYSQPQEHIKCSASERARALSPYCSSVLCTSR